MIIFRNGSFIFDSYSDNSPAKDKAKVETTLEEQPVPDFEPESEIKSCSGVG